MERKKLQRIIIIFLVLVNLGTVGYMWWSRQKKGPPNIEMADKLGFEGKEREEVTEIEKEHHRLKRDLIQKDWDYHQELYENIGQNKDVSDIQQKMLNNADEIEIMTYEFFDTIATYCNHEQLEKLSKTIEGAFSNLRKPPPKK